MRDFTSVAEVLISRKGLMHVAIILVSLLMIPGLIAGLTPIDVEDYDMESPELTADDVLNEEFASTEITFGLIVVVRDPAAAESGPAAPHSDDSGDALRAELPQPDEIMEYQGDGAGLEGEGIPVGGVLNLSVLREIDAKVEALQAHPIATFFVPMVSEVTGGGSDGVLALPDHFRTFMSNESMLTRPAFDLLGNPLPAKTQWQDCGVLECLGFDDRNLTQSHIDLAAHRILNSTDGVFLRWLSNDRAFLPDPMSPVIGPVGGLIGADGTFAGGTWTNGRWSSSSTWILVQADRAGMEAAGFTFSWADARKESDGWTYHGSSLLTTPPTNTAEFCLAEIEAGRAPCSAEWAILSMEESARIQDELTVTLAIGEGVNIEVNRELQQSMILLAGMVLVVLVLLWASLRRVSDVVIVATTLGISILWMQGLIGWFILLGDEIGIVLISRSQFSTLLPILILALGIDDSLHTLHRYKEERRGGATPTAGATEALSKVGRAVMLTSVTTMAAFAANLTSDIPALRSFGLEAALGVGSAFILTGLWAPLIRLDIDNWLEREGRLEDERKGQLHLVPEFWLARISSGSGYLAPLILVLMLVITAFAIPVMLTLEGDFKVEDFLDEESDFAAGVKMVNTRFSDEGEPAAIVIEGDMLDPRVFQAIGEVRDNMNQISERDPDRFTRTPTGKAELHGVDELVTFALLSFVNDSAPFRAAGWNPTAESNGVDCPSTVYGLPNITQRGCLQFLYGYLFVHGVPQGGLIPEIPASIPRLYILPDCEIDPLATHLCADGTTPRYERMTLRFGLRQPEQFPIVEMALEELTRDMSPLQNLSAGRLSVRGSIDSTFDDAAGTDNAVSWAIPTGEPVIRYVAASSMQKELQGTLSLGVFFCLVTLWWGFRPEGRRPVIARCENTKDAAALVGVALVSASVLGSVMALIYGSTYGMLVGFSTFCFALLWGRGALRTALITTAPILIVVIWLYGIIAAAGYSLNMVTVAIAAMSLGVGIDYVIHVVVRFKEERARGHGAHASLAVLGGASGLALVGSAVSDVMGFALISLSPMGFFSAFGLFCAVMIGLSLVASLVFASAMLGGLRWREIYEDSRAAGGFMARQRSLESELGITVASAPISESE